MLSSWNHTTKPSSLWGQNQPCCSIQFPPQKSFSVLHVILNVTTVSQNRCAGHSITVGLVCPWTTLFASVTAMLHSQHRSIRKRPNLKKKIFCCGNCFHSFSSVIWLARACAILSPSAAMGGSAPLRPILYPVLESQCAQHSQCWTDASTTTPAQLLLVLKCSFPLAYS